MKIFTWIIVIIGIGIIVWAFVMKKQVQMQEAATPIPGTEQTTGTDTQSQQAPMQPAAGQTATASGAVTTKDGMKIETTKQGTGPAIATGQTASVHYEGKLADGSVFDSTAAHGGTPFDFKLGAGMVIQGWEEGVLGMKVGETRVLTIPPELGYGAAGYPPVIPQNATLTFTVTLVGIK